MIGEYFADIHYFYIEICYWYGDYGESEHEQHLELKVLKSDRFYAGVGGGIVLNEERVRVVGCRKVEVMFLIIDIDD